MLPCSEVHWKILPAVSREIALCLEKAEVPQSRIAAALGTTPSAVSQYLKGKRGGMKLEKDVKEACKSLAEKIAAGEVSGQSLNLEIARIIAIAKKTKLGENDPCVICMGVE